MLLDTTCAFFLHGNMERTDYIEFLRQSLRHGDGQTMGELAKAIHGAAHALEIGADMVRETMIGPGCGASALHLCMYCHLLRLAAVVVHVVVFLCAGLPSEL